MLVNILNKPIQLVDANLLIFHCFKFFIKRNLKFLHKIFIVLLESNSLSAHHFYDPNS